MPALPWQQAYKWQTFAYKHVHRQPLHSGIFLTLQSSSWSAPAAKPRLAMLQQHLDIFMPTAASEGKDTAFVPVLWVLLGRQTTRRFPCLTRKKKIIYFPTYSSYYSSLIYKWASTEVRRGTPDLSGKRTENIWVAFLITLMPLLISTFLKCCNFRHFNVILVDIV